MQATREDVDKLAARFVECTPELDQDERRVSIAIYRLLAAGEPVPVASVASRVGLPEARVQEALDGWPGVFYDDAKSIVGYWGLAIPKMSHRFEVARRTLYTWCAWDSLFLPQILGQEAHVESTCPVTGGSIRLVVAPNRVRGVEPTSTVMSFPKAEHMELGDDVVTSFCHYVHFFSSPDAAAEWIRDNPHHLVLSLDQSFALAQKKNSLQFGDMLDAD